MGAIVHVRGCRHAFHVEQEIGDVFDAMAEPLEDTGKPAHGFIELTVAVRARTDGSRQLAPIYVDRFAIVAVGER